MEKRPVWKGPAGSLQTSRASDEAKAVPGADLVEVFDGAVR
jgi:hypothetical protein